MNKFFLTGATMLLIATALPAQKLDFNGTWLLQERTVISGNDYANGVPKLVTLSQSKDSLAILRVSTGANDDTRFTMTASLNGKECKMITRPTRIRSTTIAVNKDNSGFIEKAFFTTEGQDKPDQRSIYTWTFSDGGNSLTIHRDDENLATGEKFQQKGVYKKQ